MILLCGIPSETPIAMVRAELGKLSVPYAMFNQRRFAEAELELGLDAAGVGGRLELDGRSYRLDAIEGVYIRLMDDRALPELDGEPADSPTRRFCRALHDTLMRWCEVSPARVLNRVAPMTTNASKPYQAQLIRASGLRVPETLVTNDPQRVLAFRRRHGRIIYKSISGARSIVQTLEDEDLPRLERIRWCPVQFQEFIDGTNVRVHTVGGEVFATAAETDATDYRYAGRQGGSAELTAVTISDDLSERCLRLASTLGLDFAGIDLKITPEGRVYCFEVNPSPAFSWYEASTGQPIARAVARYLAGGAPSR